eukprot:TRINITY_DN10862_c0_g1_i1.p1 TRINITY_DN10862_c0_g1~~TRINITY_DN10862_c0_g1_i1.p1  ORF type:complete len:1361 (+),score=221.18 TRINITY_DN10862_c0_g1_i1:458-4084(+)
MDGTVSKATRLSFVTTGWLLMFLAHKVSELSQYTHIVLDEVHERDLDMDLLCLLLKNSLAKYPRLRLVLMSATVDSTQFLSYFERHSIRVEKDPVVVGSRRFPTFPFFLDDLTNGALPGVVPKVRMDRFDRDGKVEVNNQLFDVCAQVINALAKPGICVLVFLPGLSEIEQLHETLMFSSAVSCKLDMHMLHSVVPHEQQRSALSPPPKGHCKIVLSTNIAESSVTIPDVRYILDFGIVRKMVFDEERAMQTLCNTWSSQATCRQRRGRCGRLQEGVIIYLFPRSHYEKLQPFASPEVLGTPLESIYLKCKVLLHHQGEPEELLGDLIDSPPRTRITAAAQNLRDLGALQGNAVGELGRIAVFMPTTIQLTKLIVISWALGIPADGVVIAAALSTQDVFKLATQANCHRPEDFPQHLADNYITRARFDGGQFSEPIMYRNLYMDFLTVDKKQARQYHQWLERSCVAKSRMNQFAALVTELAARLGWAVKSARTHPALKRLADLKQSQHMRHGEVDDFFTKDFVKLKAAIVGAFQPSFVQGEINTANKNRGKITNCGYDPKKTCLLQQIKPEAMANENYLWEFCTSLAPTSDLRLNETGKIAFIECGDDAKVQVPQSDVVHQMPLLAQLLHQLMRQQTKFKVLTDNGIHHEPSKIGSPNFLNGMKWHVNGMRTHGCPYWRSNMGYMCEMRSELKCHWGVCSSLLGRDGPDVRISGLTILPPPGQMSGTVMILAFLSGPFHVAFIGDVNDGFKGVEILASDAVSGTRPMVLSFSPGWWALQDIQCLNDFRMSMNSLLEDPNQSAADGVTNQYGMLMATVDRKVKDANEERVPWNDFLPAADEHVAEGLQVWADMETAPFGSLQLYRIQGMAAPERSRDAPMPGGLNSEVTEDISGHAKYRASTSWLRHLPTDLQDELKGDLRILRKRFGLATAELVPTMRCGLPADVVLDITGSKQAVQAASDKLVSGSLSFYSRRMNWSASEMPVDSDDLPVSEVPVLMTAEAPMERAPATVPPPKRAEAPATVPPQKRAEAPMPSPAPKRVWAPPSGVGAKDAGHHSKPATAAAPPTSVRDLWRSKRLAPPVQGKGDASCDNGGGGDWGDAPVVPTCDWDAPTAEAGAWDSCEVEASGWDAQADDSRSRESQVPGLAEILHEAGLLGYAAAINKWAQEMGAAEGWEVLDSAADVAEELCLDSNATRRLLELARQRGYG